MTIFICTSLSTIISYESADLWDDENTKANEELNRGCCIRCN